MEVTVWKGGQQKNKDTFDTEIVYMYVMPGELIEGAESGS
jgi:hypothetical protein